MERARKAVLMFSKATQVLLLGCILAAAWVGRFDALAAAGSMLAVLMIMERDYA